ncbi:ABC transporter ATP-binding protein/permease [Patescibacteria group bacterium]|nr:ABC transporter ATP-binding protein/permease [Patescibacteria group bacterium]
MIFGKKINKFINWFNKYFRDSLFQAIVGEKKRNLLFFILSIIPNFVAALMEGLSYGCILMAFQVFGGNGINFNANKLYKLFGMMIGHLSQNRQFLFFLFWALIVQFLRSALMFVAQYIVSYVSLRISTDLRNRIYRQMFNITYPLISRYNTADLLEYPNTPNVIPGMLFNLNAALSSGFLIIIAFFCMMKINVILTCTTICIFLVIYLGYNWLIKKFQTFSMDLSDKSISYGAKALQFVNAIKLVHIFSKQEIILNSLKKYLQSLAYFNNKINFWQAVISTLGEVIGIVVISILLFVGVIALHNQTTYLPMLLVFITIAYRVSMRMHLCISSATQIATQAGGFKRLRKILSTKGKRFISQEGTEIKTFKNSIFLNNISLKYRGRKVSAIKNFTFSLNKGETIALVGKSGAGKSSIVDVLLRLYKITEGEILLDGTNIDNFKINDYRRLFGVVLQDVVVFPDSIEENIRFGSLDYTSIQVETAAKLAGAHEFIMKLPNKYKTLIGEKGHRLSGGERQRISLARALLTDPQILILDEATSQLDSHSENIIQQAIDKIRKEKTIIIVAHRLSTIKNADKILVFESGSLIEYGEHESLLSKNGLYAYFWKMQSKKEKKEELILN